MNLDKFTKNESINSSTSRGLISGFIGGLAGTAVKSVVERFLEVRKIDETSAQMKVVDELSEQITGSPVKIENEAIAEQLVNVPLGCFVGTGYGYSKREDLDINLMDGVLLGTTTWATTHETTLPLVGLEKSPKDIPIKTQLNELFAHVLFGVTTEIVRGFVNEKLEAHSRAE